MRQTHMEKIVDFFAEVGLDFSPSYKERIVQLKNFYSNMVVELYENKAPNPIISEVNCMLGFFKDGARIYKLCENFGRDLYKANLDVPVDMIPKVNETICIEFPDCISLQHSDGACVKTVYVRQDEFIENDLKYRGIRFQFPDYDEFGAITQQVTYININLQLPCKTVSELISSTPVLTSNFSVNMDAINLAFKAYIYLHSGEPDLRFQRHIDYPETQKLKKRKRYFSENQGKFVDVTLLGYEHKKNKIYSVDTFEVTGHFRWQRIGEALNKIKLIWIDRYTKHPKNIIRKVLNSEENICNS